ncbi:MAG TPA: polysaccharide biosynthesis tyrosine autokinase [Gaiellaceae bacterium]|nr:polysaccharide biosynthesis tyrosine autokinase [Gaiellaceae bacterium]
MIDAQTEAGAQQRGLTDYLRILRRRKWYVLATTVLVVALSVAFALRQPKEYRARSQVLLTRSDIAAVVTGAPQDPALSEDPARYAQTQATIARSGAIAALALKNARVSDLTPSGLLGESSVTPSATADVLDFVVHDRDQARAAQLVNAYADAFVTYKLGLDTNALFRARQQLNQQLTRLRALRLQATPQYRDLLNSEQQLHTMQLLQSQDAVLTHPTAGVQVKPTPKRDGLLGLGFGLVLGLGLAFAAEALDRRVRTEEEVEHALALPLLGRVPAPPRQLRAGVAMLDEPRGSYAEAIRRLATSIVFSNPDRDAEVLTFTSALQQEGKSTTVANLGVALAASGNEVAVVDLDLRQPALATLFHIHRLTGLTDVAVGRTQLDDALVRVELPDLDRGQPGGDAVQASSPGALYVLPTGPLPVNPGEFVASDAVAARVLVPLRQRFDYVLVDTPPISVVGDAARLSARTDGIVVVSRLGLVHRSALHDLKRQLAAAPVTPLGVVAAGVHVPSVDGYARYADRGQLAARSRNGRGDRSRLSRRVRA